jgi:uncharacterized membrane protein YccC
MTAEREAVTWVDAGLLARAIRPAGPALLFGLRLWASVCLALFVAFWLQLENPAWAGTTAAIVCQPQLGASLRKASFRMVGTVVGAVAIVILTACFPQNRAGFLIGLALWGAACCFMATILRNFAGYAAALAGFTAAIIASDELGATGGPYGDVLILAITRATEIGIGIVCAGVVLAGTDFGNARRRLAAQFAALSAEIAGRVVGAFTLAGLDQPDSRPIRRDLIRRVIALDPIIDAAIGEASDLRYRSPVLQTAVGGLFAALSAWRMIALHLDRLPIDAARRETELIDREFEPALRAAPRGGDATGWIENPTRIRHACLATARALTAMPAAAPSPRLLADSAAEAFLGVARALNGLTLLTDPRQAISGRRAVAALRVPDWLPAILNAVRAFVAIGVVALFWIVTAWPSGAQALVFAAIVTLLFSPQADQAYPGAMAFLLGATLSAILAAIFIFAVLPRVTSFPGLCLVMGLVLVPLSSMIALPWRPVLCTAATVNFIPLLSPANQMTYDAQQFYNSALAILAGIGAATLAIRVLPPLSPATRSRRLLDLTLVDLRRLAKRPEPRTRAQWESRVYGRLLALPEKAEPLQCAQLAAALSVGTQIIRLRNLAPKFNLAAALGEALDALARGRSRAATERLAQLDRALSAPLSASACARVSLRARASILALSEALEEFASYFDSGEGR